MGVKNPLKPFDSQGSLLCGVQRCCMMATVALELVPQTMALHARCLFQSYSKHGTIWYTRHGGSRPRNLAAQSPHPGSKISVMSPTWRSDVSNSLLGERCGDSKKPQGARE